MKLDELSRLISSTEWFGRIGEPDYEGLNGFVSVPNLDEWRGVTEMLANEPEPLVLKLGMDWLPSSMHEEDPVHGQSLEEEAQRLGRKEELSRQIFHIYKTALVSLRSFDGHPLMRGGANDFTNAARASALYCCRRAAWEVLLEQPGFWCHTIDVYHKGHWPMGRMPNGDIVVL